MPDASNIETVTFTLNGREVTTEAGQTIWEAAQAEGTTIPHLCHKPEPGYRSDGNCRACMVEVKGERTLVASCIRPVSDGLVVTTESARAEKARKTVMELLIADQPDREAAHDRSSHLWKMADQQGVSESRFPAVEQTRVPLLDSSHAAMQVNLDACIHCNLCVRACREVQVNDVIGMSGRGHDAQITFDINDPMGTSTCVACGECVQACPTGALMAATALDKAGNGDSAAIDREVNTVCPYCGVGCQLTFKIKDDKIAWVEGAGGPANENRLCVKGRFGFDYVAHPHRLTKPLIRRDDAPAKGLNVDPAKPLEFFREATWEEAMEKAAQGFINLRDNNGGTSVAGFGSAKCSNEEAYLFQKLIRTGFGHNNVDHCTRLCHASSVAALMENVGSGAVTATFNEIENADVAIVIGCNPIENHPVAATYFKQFTKRGGKLIVMDPRGQGLKRHATHMLQFRPGTDVAMLNAIMHVIITEELFDRQYIASFTEGFDEMKSHLKDFTPEAMAPICGIDADTLRDVARLFAGAKAGMVFWGMGVSQHIHGTDNARCLISLTLMCGHVGRPGAGLHPLRGQNNVQGASDAGLIPMLLPDYQSVAEPSVRELFKDIWNGFDVDPNPGLTIVEIVNAMYDGDIKGMYVLGENPAMSDPDAGHARDALAKLEHLVVQDIFLTETANFADVILPATAWAEKTGTVTNTNRQVQMGRAAVPAPGEAREDWAIVTDLARRLGLEWTYEHPRDVFNEMKRSMKSLNNITWERLENENVVTYPSLSET
ncbi:MAG: molybdopterin-dependent oxidoreductase, partial [Rhodospirillaceae bacterium]|nr:molybdopterin-dependent oxidoreductase [Rhodospirillaceae bacterium]